MENQICLSSDGFGQTCSREACVLQHTCDATGDMQQAHKLSAYPHEQNFSGVLLLCFKEEGVQGSFAVLGSPPLA